MKEIKFDPRLILKRVALLTSMNKIQHSYVIYVITIIGKHMFTISSRTSLLLSWLVGKQAFVKSVLLSPEPNAVLASTDITIISKMIDHSSYHIPSQLCRDESVVIYSCYLILLIHLLKSKQEYIKTSQNAERNEDDSKPPDHFLVK